MEYIELGAGLLGLIKEIYLMIKSFFWRNKNIIYINSNKKFFPVDDLDSLPINTKTAKLLQYQKIVDNENTFPTKHFKKQNYCLFQILRNLKNRANITYGGFVSPPLAIYDGFILSDIRSYTFADISSKTNMPYICRFQKDKNASAYKKFNIPNNATETCLLISSSKIIGEKAVECFPYHKTHYKNSKLEVTDADLTEIFNYVYNYLDACSRNGIQKVHLFVSAKQPISFIIGTAIQRNHPEVIAYEFCGAKYVWGLNIRNKEIIKL